MANSDGSVIFSTEIDESGLKKGLNGLKSMAGTLAKGASVAIGGVSAGLSGLAKVAFDYNTAMETYHTNFAVLLGDEAQAQEFVTRMKERAAKTPFGMEDLASASQTLLSFGLSAEETESALSQIGDISLGNSEKLSNLSLAFAQVASAGKLSGQDLLQMINSGFNPLNTIAEKTGASLGDLKEVMAGGKGSEEFQALLEAARKEVKELGDEASEGAKMLVQMGDEGQISADLIGRAMEIETSPGGKFYNGMQQASTTTAGMISTLKDDATALIGEVFAPLTDQIGQTLVPMASSYVQQMTEAFQSEGITGLTAAMGDIVADSLAQVAANAPKMIELASGIVVALLDGIQANSGEIASGLSSTLVSAVTGISETVPEILSAGLEIATALLNGLTDALPDLIPKIISGIVDGLVVLCQNADDFASAALSIAGALVDGVIKAIPTLVTGVGDALVALFTTEDEKVAAIAEKYQTEFDTSIAAFEEFQNTLDAADAKLEASTVDAEAKKQLASDLLALYTELEQKDVKTDADLALMSQYAQSIAEIYPSLSGYIDPATGSFTLNSNAIRENIAAQHELMMLDAYKSYQQETYAALAQANIALHEHTVAQQGVYEEWERLKTQSEGVKDLYEGVDAGRLPFIYENLDEICNTIQEIGGYENPLDGLVTQAEDGSWAVSDCADSVALLNAVETQLIATLGASEEAFSVQNEVLVEAYAAEATLTAAVNDQQTAVDNVNAMIAEQTAKYQEVTGAASEAGTAVEASGENMKTGSEAMLESGQNAKTAAEDFQTAAQDSTAAADAIQSKATEIDESTADFDKVVDDFSGAETATEKAAETVTESAQTVETESAATSEAVSQSTEAMIATLQTLLSTLEEALTNAEATFNDAGDRLVGEISAGMQNALTAAKVDAQTIAQTIVSTLADELTKRATSVNNAASNIVKNAITAAKGQTGGASSIGTALADGVASGITSRAWKVKDALVDAVEEAVKAAKKAADINSPSGLTRREIGYHLPTGAAQGVDENAWTLRESLEDMVTNSLPEDGLLTLGINLANMSTQGRVPASSPSVDAVAIARAIWAEAPEIAIQQIVNFYEKVQTPDEVTRALRSQNTAGLVGGKS